MMGGDSWISALSSTCFCFRQHRVILRAPFYAFISLVHLVSLAAVGTLVSALKKQAKFRQLVEYSLDTLVKAIPMPTLNLYSCINYVCHFDLFSVFFFFASLTFVFLPCGLYAVENLSDKQWLGRQCGWIGSGWWFGGSYRYYEEIQRQRKTLGLLHKLFGRLANLSPLLTHLPTWFLQPNHHHDVTSNISKYSCSKASQARSQIYQAPRFGRCPEGSPHQHEGQSQIVERWG